MTTWKLTTKFVTFFLIKNSPISFSESSSWAAPCFEHIFLRWAAARNSSEKGPKKRGFGKTSTKIHNPSSFTHTLERKVRKLIEPFKIPQRFISALNNLDEWNMVCFRPNAQEPAVMNIAD